ncbi:hypothetical protein, partial [Prochlorococcus marinus]
MQQLTDAFIFYITIRKQNIWEGLLVVWLVIVDSARAVARSMNVDENHAEFGKRVIRKIAKFINDCGKSGV